MTRPALSLLLPSNWFALPLGADTLATGAELEPDALAALTDQVGRFQALAAAVNATTASAAIWQLGDEYAVATLITTWLDVTAAGPATTADLHALAKAVSGPDPASDAVELDLPVGPAIAWAMPAARTGDLTLHLLVPAREQPTAAWLIFGIHAPEPDVLLGQISAITRSLTIGADS